MSFRSGRSSSSSPGCVCFSSLPLYWHARVWGRLDSTVQLVMVGAFKSHIIIVFYLCDSPLFFQQVILAQCAVYLARAPKSVDIYQAYANVKACLRNHKGPLPSVPLHLRNAPTKLMKQLGYAEGYKYNPAFSNPVEQEYLPEELRGTNFFTWKPSDTWLTATLNRAAKLMQFLNAM